MTHSNQDEDEGADFERKANNLDAKEKRNQLELYQKQRA